MVVRIWRSGVEWYVQTVDSLHDFFNYGPFTSREAALAWAAAEALNVAPHLLS